MYSHFSTGRNDLLSQDEPVDYLTPQDAPGLFSTFAVASPSPIKKKSRHSRGSRDLMVPDGVDEEDDEDDDDSFDHQPCAPSKGGHSFSRSRGLGGRVEADADDYGNDFRSLSQGLSQSVVDGLGSLKMNSSSEDEDVMQSSQEAAMSFRLKSVGADWDVEDQGDDVNGDAKNRESRLNSAQEPEEGMTQVISIPSCSMNPFERTENGRVAADGRKRQRQKKIKIPVRDAGSGAPLTVSTYLMHFEQLDMIGDGRFSRVHKCRARADGWIYAVKQSKHSLTTMVEQQNGAREVFALAALQGCPHLVRYQRAWFEDNRVYICTEFCPGGSLDSAVFPRANWGQWQASGRFQSSQFEAGESANGQQLFNGTETELLRVARDIGSALSFMHDRGVVHMDVKPANIFLAADGTFKLGDLGHAVKCDGSMAVEEGDERYLSDDVLKGLDLFKFSKGAHVPDYQTILAPNDVFGLGASLYELATRTRLESSGPEFHKLREGQLQPVPGASAGFKSLLRSMLAPALQERPTAAEVVQAADRLLAAAATDDGSTVKLMERIQQLEERNHDLERMVLSLSA